MVNDWIKTTLDDVCIKITDGAHKSPKSVDSGKPMASVKDLEFYGLNLETARHISEEDYLDLVKQGCKPELNDVLIAKDGNSALDTVCTFEKDDEVVLLSSVAILRPNPEKINSRFLKYYFLSARTIDYLKKNFISGAAIPRVVLRDFKKAEILLPLIPEQEAIAHILGSLDDKIELNRTMNETLETMAQALFKSWFVDFDLVIDNAFAAGNAIPDEFAERVEQRKGIEKKDNAYIQSLFPDGFKLTEEMGWIPKGWAIGKYSDLAELNSQYWSKKSMPEEISYVDLGNTNNGKIDLVVSYSSSEAPSRAKRVLSTDDTIIGTVRPGNRSFAFIHNEGLTGSTGFAVMKPIQSMNRTYIYLGLTQSVVIEYLAHIADGGAYPAINPSVVADLECIIPPSEVLGKFDSLAYCFLKKIGENNNHNETLAKLRDTLLPKLMSGELRIPDAAALVDEVK